MKTINIKENFHQYLLQLQVSICRKLEEIDGTGKFQKDEWSREEGGGGLSCIISNGSVFEKGGVNVSAVFGHLPFAMQQAFKVNDSRFFCMRAFTCDSSH